MSGVKLRISTQRSKYGKRNTETEYYVFLQFSDLKSILSHLPLFEICTCTSVNNF